MQQQTLSTVSLGGLLLSLIEIANELWELSQTIERDWTVPLLQLKGISVAAVRK